MRPTFDVIDTTIQIETRMALQADGKIVVVTHTRSHGDAKYTSLGRLENTGDGWAVYEASTLGMEVVVLVEETKAEALRQYARRATSRAAQWAVSA